MVLREARAVVLKVFGNDDDRTRALGDKMVELAQLAAHDPDFVFWARAAVRDVPSKAHHVAVRRLLDWVRATVRYRYDPLGLEWVQDPRHTLLVDGAGDCFVRGTFVLRRDGHALVPIESLRLGDEVWGRDRWSRVMQVWDRGVRKTWLVQLNNGSAIRLTPEHKVWVARCGHHGFGTRSEREHACPVSERHVVRVPLSEVRRHEVLIQPGKVECGSGAMDPRRAYVEGLYVADGNMHHKAGFQIAGRDGFPREEQKREVAAICRDLGIETKWRFNYVEVRDPDWAARVSAMGGLPWVKRILSLDLDEATVRETLRGVLVDSGRNRNGGGRTFTTSSRELCLQVRVLLRMLGVSCGEAFVPDHGSTSKYPVWRLYIRAHQVLDSLGVIRDRAWRSDAPQSAGPNAGKKLLRVRSIIRDCVEQPCWDIATDDHCVWLPEVDWTTSQCDDGSALIAALAVALGYRATVRFVKADRSRPDEFSHVYTVVGIPDGRGGEEWIALDWTQAHAEPGWEPPYWAKMDMAVA